MACMPQKVADKAQRRASLDEPRRESMPQGMKADLCAAVSHTTIEAACGNSITEMPGIWVHGNTFFAEQHAARVGIEVFSGDFQCCGI